MSKQVDEARRTQQRVGFFGIPYVVAVPVAVVLGAAVMVAALSLTASQIPVQQEPGAPRVVVSVPTAVAQSELALEVKTAEQEPPVVEADSPGIGIVDDPAQQTKLLRAEIPLAPETLVEPMSEDELIIVQVYVDNGWRIPSKEERDKALSAFLTSFGSALSESGRVGVISAAKKYLAITQPPDTLTDLFFADALLAQAEPSVVGFKTLLDQYRAQPEEVPSDVLDLYAGRASRVAYFQVAAGELDPSRLAEAQANFDELVSVHNELRTAYNAQVQVEISAAIAAEARAEAEAAARTIVEQVERTIVEWRESSVNAQMLEARVTEGPVVIDGTPIIGWFPYKAVDLTLQAVAAFPGAEGYLEPIFEVSRICEIGCGTTEIWVLGAHLKEVLLQMVEGTPKSAIGSYVSFYTSVSEIQKYGLEEGARMIFHSLLLGR